MVKDARVNPSARTIENKATRASNITVDVGCVAESVLRSAPTSSRDAAQAVFLYVPQTSENTCVGTYASRHAGWRHHHWDLRLLAARNSGLTVR